MARLYARILRTVWAADSDFRRLGGDAQRMYLLLISQPQISWCGVLPYTPDRWALYAADDTRGGVDAALAELVRERYIVIDRETDEVLVRTYIRHDEVERSPNLRKAACRQFHEVQSTHIRMVLYGSYPHLFQGSEEPLPEGLPEPLPEGLPKGIRPSAVEGNRERTVLQSDSDTHIVIEDHPRERATSPPEVGRLKPISEDLNDPDQAAAVIAYLTDTTLKEMPQ